MDISIAMCTYNGSRFLETQLHSISRQLKLPLELVICDDGSSDDTSEIVQRFAATVPFAVRFHRNAGTLGSTKNFEQAMKLCRGEVIALCDQDDLWEPEKLSVMAAVLEAEPAIVGVFSNARLIDGDGSALPDDLWRRVGFNQQRQERFKEDAPAVLIHSDVVTGATFLFRSEWLSRMLPIPREWVHDGWIALLLAILAEVRALPVCPMSYRIHAAQQVGAPEVAWHDHLSTETNKARAAHRLHAARLRLIRERIDTLGTQMPSTQTAKFTAASNELQRKLRFIEGRAQLLDKPRTQRIAALRMLSSYVRYEKGVMSLLRDLTHKYEPTISS
jgi:hypothetical protein